MKGPLIGRIAETAVLTKALQSDEAELVAVLGRRRVGKTFLVRSVYENRIVFEMTGIQKGTLKEQLQHFTDRLNLHSKPVIPLRPPATWMEAFQMLTLFLESRKPSEKSVLFFDEVPWIATRKSDFLKAFGLFWNSWASQNQVVVVICGSAASWMIQKVVRDKGGLHNRITRRVHLQPFSLAETEAWFRSKSFNFERYHILQLYMAMGGIPHYLKEVEGGESAAQNIDRICFSKNGLLYEEFGQLYASLFDHSENHVKIIRVLSEKWQGMSRQEIIDAGKFPNGGTITTTFEELEQSGFIMPFYTFGKQKKGIVYRLTDEYSLFYLKFMENKRLEERGSWEKFSQTQAWKTWSGYAFENLCLRHIAQIKKALGISGIYSETSTFRSQPVDGMPGIRVDLLIDRNDHVINLFELKFRNSEFVLTKAYAAELRTKLAVFKTVTKTRKQVFLTFLTTFGLFPNEHSSGLVDRKLTTDALFLEDVA